jgi:uncharacterized membrane protein
MQDENPSVPILRSTNLLPAFRVAAQTPRRGEFLRRCFLSFMLGKRIMMRKPGLPKLVFALLAVGAAFYFSSLYAQLPEVLASHFDARGVANGWQTKSAFFGFLVGVSVLAAVVGFGIPRIISATPPELINLPNKRYWLAPERRAETMDFLNSYFAWLGCALFAVILLAINFAIQANLHPDRRPDATPMWFVLAGFLTFAILGTLRMFKRFGPPSEANSSLK